MYNIWIFKAKSRTESQFLSSEFVLHKQTDFIVSDYKLCN
jgi:hypothetical protein